MKFNESERSVIGCYYVPYNVDQIELIKRVLEKLDITNAKRIINQMSEYPNWRGFYLFVSKILGQKDGSFWIIRNEHDLLEWKKHITKDKIEYLGEYELDEHEISAIKYNL